LLLISDTRDSTTITTTTTTIMNNTSTTTTTIMNHLDRLHLSRQEEEEEDDFEIYNDNQQQQQPTPSYPITRLPVMKCNILIREFDKDFFHITSKSHKKLNTPLYDKILSLLKKITKNIITDDTTINNIPTNTISTTTTIITSNDDDDSNPTTITPNTTINTTTTSTTLTSSNPITTTTRNNKEDDDNTIIEFDDIHIVKEDDCYTEIRLFFDRNLFFDQSKITDEDLLDLLGIDYNSLLEIELFLENMKDDKNCYLYMEIDFYSPNEHEFTIIDFDIFFHYNDNIHLRNNTHIRIEGTHLYYTAIKENNKENIYF
jgi:hypothetical protein